MAERTFISTVSSAEVVSELVEVIAETITFPETVEVPATATALLVWIDETASVAEVVLDAVAVEVVIAPLFSYV